MDSPKRASEAIPALEGAAQEASLEAGKALEDGVPVEGPSDADRVAKEAPSKIVVRPLFFANAGP